MPEHVNTSSLFLHTFTLNLFSDCMAEKNENEHISVFETN